MWGNWRAERTVGPWAVASAGGRAARWVVLKVALWVEKTVCELVGNLVGQRAALSAVLLAQTKVAPKGEKKAALKVAPTGERTADKKAGWRAMRSAEHWAASKVAMWADNLAVLSAVMLVQTRADRTVDLTAAQRAEMKVLHWVGKTVGLKADLSAPAMVDRRAGQSAGTLEQKWVAPMADWKVDLKVAPKDMHWAEHLAGTRVGPLVLQEAEMWAAPTADSKAERTERSSVEHLVGLRAVVSAGYWVAQRAAR